MSLHSFCGVLTLQVGVAILAIIFWAIAYLTFIVNFFDFFDTVEFPVFALSILFFVIFMVLAGAIAFFSAYNENQKLAMTGVAVLCLTLVVWITMACMSFLNDSRMIQYVCVRQERCPESFWMAPLRYRMSDEGDIGQTNESSEVYGDYTGNTPATETTTLISETTTTTGTDTEVSVSELTSTENLAPIKTRMTTTEPNYNLFYDDADDIAPSVKLQRSGYKFDVPLIGAVILFLCNLLFFLFSILVLWSYGQELTWTDCYI